MLALQRYLIFTENLRIIRSLAMSLTKGVALVTGAAQGIGRAIAIRLARDGFSLALNDLPVKKDALEDLAAELQRGGASEGPYHPRTCIVTADLTKEDDVKNMVDNAVGSLGSLDVVSSGAQWIIIELTA